MRTLTIFLLAATGALAEANDELAAWVQQDCNDYRTLVTQINHAQSAHDVATALRENVRRQRHERMPVSPSVDVAGTAWLGIVTGSGGTADRDHRW